MKIYLFASAAALLVTCTLPLLVRASSETPTAAEEKAREERIRYNLRKGAFHLNNGVYNENAAPAVEATPFKNMSRDEVRARLREWGVDYLFMLDNSDLKKPQEQPYYTIADFMGNAQAESRGGKKFRAENCGRGRHTSLNPISDAGSLVGDSGTSNVSGPQSSARSALLEDRSSPASYPPAPPSDFPAPPGNSPARSRNSARPADRAPAPSTASYPVAAHFDRLSPNDQTGGYLLVKEADAGTTNLSPYEGFSMGAWVKLHADGNGNTASGGFPILSKTPLNQVNAQGRSEWEFRVTGNVVYIDISRQGHTQVLSFNIPWWGDRWGSCYSNGVYQDCWHYIGVSFDPSIHKVGVLFLRKFANQIPEPAAESFGRIETNAGENATPMESSRQTPLRIGGSNASSMDGILKGVFFARKALSASELKSMALLTAPTKEGLFCARP